MELHPQQGKMSNPCIVCVAITGSLPTKENNPALPITITEQIESTHESFEAGASIVYCHMRDDEGKLTSDPQRLARRANASVLLDDGVIRKQIAKILFIDDDTIKPFCRAAGTSPCGSRLKKWRFPAINPGTR
jgi:beta-keto acid cleavage enzyme